MLKKVRKITKEEVLAELAKEDLQVLVLAYMYAKNLHMYGEDVTKAICTATENVAVLDNAYQKGYCDAIDKMMAESKKDVCKDCYYNDGEVHAECVICDKAESEE